MATELETRTTSTTTTGRRIFSGLNSTETVQYRRPNFSGIQFDNIQEVDVQTNYDTTVEQITVDTPKKMDMLTVDKVIEQRPQTPLKVHLNARGRIVVSVLAICICALVAFMIGNIITINNLNNAIIVKQQYVAEQQQIVNDLQEEYNSLEENVMQNATNNGYITIDSSNVSYLNDISIIEKAKPNIDDNWFDNLCTWLSNLFN